MNFKNKEDLEIQCIQLSLDAINTMIKEDKFDLSLLSKYADDIRMHLMAFKHSSFRTDKEGE